MEMKEWMNEKRKTLENMIEVYGWNDVEDFKVSETYRDKKDPTLTFEICVIMRKDKNDNF